MPSVVGRYARARSVCPVISAARCCGGFMANLLSEDLPIRETGTLPPRRAALQSSAYAVLVSSDSNGSVAGLTVPEDGGSAEAATTVRHQRPRSAVLQPTA